jgi:hypothetical protein
MGSALSKGSTEEDVKDGLERLGDAFTPYAEAAAINGINGDTLYAILPKRRWTIWEK